MLDALRKPFFIASLVCMALVVLTELGSAFIITSGSSATIQDLDIPGYGISFLALLDGLLLYSLFSMGAALVIPERYLSRIQGIVTLLLSLCILIAAIVAIFVALTLLILMVSLFLAVPFGTLIYIGVYGDFPKGSAAALLSAIMTFKIASAVLLVLAQQRFLQMKSLVLLILTSLLANIVVSFLHGFTITLLTSILDVIAAIIVAILAAIWAIVFLIGSIPAVVKALRVDRVVQ